MARDAGAFRVTVFGAAHLDRLLRTDGPPVLGASNPGSARDAIGGVAFNIAAALARLGLPTTLVTRLGNDDAGDRVAAAADTAGIDPVWMSRSPDAPTATYHAVLHAAGGLVIGVADARIYDELTPDALEPALTAPAHLWIADANLPADTLAHIAAASRAAGTPLAACAVSPAKAVRFASLLRDIAIWFGNRAEAGAILGRPAGAPTPDLAAALAAAGVRSGFVSNGDAAFAAWHDGKVEIMTLLPAARIASVNGAGDAQAAGTVYGLAEGLGFLDAVRYGRAAAALKVEAEEPVREDLTRALLESRAAATAEKPA